MCDKASALLGRLIEKEPDWLLLVTRGDVFLKAGMLDEAIKDYSAAIEEVPDGAYAYYKRGWCREMKGEKDKAMEDYNLGIDNSQDYPYLYLMRGELLLGNGDKDAAEKDFETVLQKDTLADNSSTGLTTSRGSSC